MSFSRYMDEEIEPYIEERARVMDIDGINARCYTADRQRASMLVVHGFSEGMYKYREIIFNFLKMGMGCTIFEFPGHGKSRGGMTDRIHTEDFQEYVDTIKKVSSMMQDEGPRFIFAHSMGGCAAALYLEENPSSPFEKAVLSSPMLKINTHGVGENAALRLSDIMVRYHRKDNFVFGQGVWEKTNDTFQSSAGADRGRFEENLSYRTSHPEYQKSGATWKWLNEGIKASRKARSNFGKIGIPVLLLRAEDDSYVDKDVFELLENPHLEIADIPLSRHECLNSSRETNDATYRLIRDFLLPPSGGSVD